MSYLAFVALGFLASLICFRYAARGSVPATVAAPLRIAALGGAVAGAYLCELPADLFGLAPPTPDAHTHFGGRTLLGALLFGWVAVELTKRWLGHREPTGDAFALPLAVGLAIGRLGCVFTGCCPGRLIDPSSPLALPSRWLHVEARFPAALFEAYFHGAAALALVALRRPGRVPHGRSLAGYLAVYALLRAWLETERDVPRPFLGLSYYQLLAVPLFVLAFGTWLARIRPHAPRTEPLPAGPRPADSVDR